MKIGSTEVGDLIVIPDRGDFLIWIVTVIQVIDDEPNYSPIVFDIFGYSFNSQKRQRIFRAARQESVPHAALIRNGNLVIDGTKNPAIPWL